MRFLSVSGLLLTLGLGCIGLPGGRGGASVADSDGCVRLHCNYTRTSDGSAGSRTYCTSNVTNSENTMRISCEFQDNGDPPACSSWSCEVTGPCDGSEDPEFDHCDADDPVDSEL